MRSEKGITLITLIIYIIVLTLVVSMLAIVSDLFFSNTKYIKDTTKYMAEYNKFNMYFIEDVKNNKNILKISDTEIIFEDGTMYNYKKSPDNSIYRNQVKICNNIGYCNFSSKEETVKNTKKKIIEVYMIISGSKFFETNNQYVLKYW